MALRLIVKHVIAITTGTLVYLIFGTFAFHALENPNQTSMCDAAVYEIGNDLPKVVQDIEQYGLNKTNFSRLMAIVKDSIKVNVDIEMVNDSMADSVKVSCPTKWGIINSFYFCSMIISTIGYGQNSPVTPGGQMFTIFYSVIGIVIFGFFIMIWSKFLHHYYCCTLKQMVKNSKLYGKVIATTMICFLLFIIPSLIFMISQDWKFMESVYYCVITLSTIGFGDYVPGKIDGISSIWSSFYLAACTIWIYFGLVCVSVVIREMTNDMGDLLRISGGDSLSENGEQDNFSSYNSCLETLNLRSILLDPSPEYNIVVQNDNGWLIP